MNAPIAPATNGSATGPLPAKPAHKFELPNIKRMFVPDPGFVMIDADLAGADAQVVAWEAEDEDLKNAFRAGLKVHRKNAVDMWGDEFAKHIPKPGEDESPIYKKKYYEIKRAVHATNYVSTARNVAHVLGWSVREAENFQTRWFSLHPGIKRWHKRIQTSLSTSRSVANRFGYRIIFFDRIDAVFPEAVAWGPQSTVAEVCFRGALQLEEKCGWISTSSQWADAQRIFTATGSSPGPLMQVHDSLLFQIPKEKFNKQGIDEIKEHLKVPVPYPDPLTIQWGIKASDKSWGDCKEVKF